MFAKLIGWLSPYLLLAAGAVVVFALLFGAGQTWRLHRAQAKVLETQRLWDAERGRLHEAASRAQVEFRETERQWIEAVQEGQHAIDQAKKQFSQAVASLRAAATADADILRQRLAAASSGGQAAGNSGSSGDGDAATCGSLLASALRVAGECTAGAESHADTARALLGAWPR